MKHYTFLFLSLFITYYASAQFSYDGYPTTSALLASKSPKQQQNIINAQNRILNYVNQHGLNHQKTVITIPVVVHVLYHDISQNISDALVQSQIDVLNKDYNRLNSDTSLTRSIFKPVAANCQIQFKLATQDEAGFPTTGIIHSYTDTAMWDNPLDPYHITQQMKDSSIGGQVAWNPNAYLNIWVCNIHPTLLGFSSIPGDPMNEDGVVISYHYFGSGGGSVAPYDKGRTTTHEVGHWLGLYHPFEGSCVGLNSATCANTGDFCCDTPPVATADFGCNQTLNTCSEIPNMPDMVENYMMYTDDACMNMFTLDQAARMSSTINAYRTPILTSAGAATISLLSNDIGVYYIVNAIANAQNCPFPSRVRVHNFGSNTVTNFTINVQIDNDPIHQYTWTGNLPTAFNADVTLGNIAPVNTTTTHHFKAWTSLPNNVTDANSSNDSKASNFLCVANGINTTDANATLFSVFPNPGTDIITLYYSGESVNTTYTIQNAVGQLVVNPTTIRNSNNTISISTLSPGVYFLTVQAEKTKQTIKLIKN